MINEILIKDKILDRDKVVTRSYIPRYYVSTLKDKA